MILYLTSRTDWEKLKDLDSFISPSLETDGFIHCSTAEQVVTVANSFFKNTEDLLLVVIDPVKLSSELIYEGEFKGYTGFPHVYGPINMDSVTDVLEFHSEVLEGYVLPAELRNLI